MSKTFSIGAMNQLGDALENAGFSADDLTKLRKFNNLKGLKHILWGLADIKYLDPIIECDAAPFVPVACIVSEHKKSGTLLFNVENISLYLSKRQTTDLVVYGHDLRKKLDGMPVLNANVLDYLLDHPALIPKEWKKQHICFWGTIYREKSRLNGHFVRFLTWSGSEWYWGYNYLDANFAYKSPAALLKL